MSSISRYFKAFTEAVYEGKMFAKTGKFIATVWSKGWKRIDFFIGKIVRYFVMKSIPIDEKKIVFIPFQGDYTCNLKYITEELIKQNIDCEIVWAVRKSTLKKSYLYPPQIKFVDQYTAEYYNDLASSRIWVVNSVDFLKRKVYKKREQTLIQTWHGSLGIKKFDASANNGRLWVNAAKYCGKVTDYCISNSTFENSVYKDSFWAKSEILEYGHPRNDLLVETGTERRRAIQKHVREQLELSDGVRIALYAPTFRDNHKFDMYMLDYGMLNVALSERFGGEWQVLTRFHPTIRKYVSTRAMIDGFTDVTSYDDIQELMTIVDFAITDYSSWIYDFILTGKPGLIFAMDIEDYYSERGFYYPLTDTPFPICKDNDEVEMEIKRFNLEKYQQEVASFLEEKGCFEGGAASELTARKIESIILAVKC